MPVNLESYKKISEELSGQNVALVAVSKTKPAEEILELYNLGQRDFGENYVGELTGKYEQLPKDIRWHFIGHLQSNKVKYIAPFVSLIQGVDSKKLLVEIDKQAKKVNRIIDCLLQVHIAKEETKFGLDEDELDELIDTNSTNYTNYANVRICGLMGMASFTNDTSVVKNEFKFLKSLFDKYSALPVTNCQLSILSMGMSADYKIAIEEGSNMVRIGSLLFGKGDRFIMKASMKNEQKKIIIIGATSGIGRELARIYASNKFRVGVTGRRMQLLISLQEEFPENIFIECFDVTGKENIPHFQSLIEKLNGLDILIYNSGYGEPSKELDWEIESKTIAINVNGFIEIVCYAFNYFVNQGHGQIACISSIASIRGNGMAPAYSAAKSFESTYMEGLYLKAKRLRKNIAITDIQPGFVNTHMAKGDKKFWVAPVEKAAAQIFEAIQKKKKRAYITKRWAIIAWLLKYMPGFIYNRFG